MPRLAPEELLHAPPGEASACVQARVDAARTRAVARQGVPNAELSGQALREHAALASGAATFAQAIARQLALSGRGFDRLLRVARSVADLAEAASYRGE